MLNTLGRLVYNQQMSEWRDTWDSNSFFPDWKDDGAPIKIKMSDGSVHQGTLVVDDFGFDGEDEFPIFVVKTDDGKQECFWMSEQYCLIDNDT
jgi:hypothetical protein